MLTYADVCCHAPQPLPAKDARGMAAAAAAAGSSGPAAAREESGLGELSQVLVRLEGITIAWPLPPRLEEAGEDVCRRMLTYADVC